MNKIRISIKEIVITNRSETKTLGLKNTVIEMKTSLRGFNSRLEQAGKRISELSMMLKKKCCLPYQ